MICRAAIKIYDKRQNKEVIIPCHRHCDAFQILYEFGYKRFTDYEEVAQGFLDEHDNFYERVPAWIHARECGQVFKEFAPRELYSEDLW